MDIEELIPNKLASYANKPILALQLKFGMTFSATCALHSMRKIHSQVSDVRIFFRCFFE